MQLEDLEESGSHPRFLWLNRWIDRAARPWPAILELLVPGPSYAELNRFEIEGQIHDDLNSLRERVRSRNYPDTINVLVFYWLMTVRETYTPEHWPILRKEARKLAGSTGSLTLDEVRAVQQAAQWIESTRPSTGKMLRRHNFVPAFTSGQFAPPDFISQAFLETLLNDWLPERVLERYGRRHVPVDWNNESAYEEIALCLEDMLRPHFVFPDLETLHAIDRVQRRPPTPLEEIVQWRRRRQAGLESLVRVPLKDANAIDPKQREILNDVILYMLGVTGAPPEPEPGYAWLFPAPLGGSLPDDAAEQVAEFPLPAGYTSAAELLIRFTKWQTQGRSNDGVRPLSIRSTLLTPDGRIWQAHHLEQQAGSPPGIFYRAAGKIDVVPTSRGLYLRVPMASCPNEITPKFIEGLDIELYHVPWHMERIEASHHGAFMIYRRVSETLPRAAGPQRTPGSESERAFAQSQAGNWLWPKAS